MSTARGPSKSWRWTQVAALLAILSITALVLVAGDFGSSLMDNDEFRVPITAISILSWFGGLFMAVAATLRARKDGERARLAVFIAAFLIAAAAFVVVAIWVVVSAGLN